MPPVASVNKNYLDKVIDLSQVMDVAATEDIFDARGVKLIAKGARISPAVQEKLIMHKLRKPLEACLTVDGGIDIDGIVAEAQRIVETSSPVAQVMSLMGGSGMSPFEILSGLRLGNAMSLMLTITQRGGNEAFSHAIIVSLISLCLAKKAGMSHDDQANVTLAGLLHDIGELYIAPEYLHHAKRLLPHEWRHVVVHPKISQMLITELGSFPIAVAQAVADHHERLNGTGYPRQLSGPDFGMPGQILSVAEMVSGIFLTQERPLECAELALKIVPGEHSPLLVSAISGAVRNQGREASANRDGAAKEIILEAKSLGCHFPIVLQAGGNLLDSSDIRSNPAKLLLRRALERIEMLQRALISTGMDATLLTDEAIVDDVEFVFEATLITREIIWRLRDVARDLSLHSQGLESRELVCFEGLIALIDEGHQATLH